VKRILFAVAMALLVAGCADDDQTTTVDVDTGTTTTTAETAAVRVYWLRDGKVWPALREVDTSGPVENIAGLAVSELLNGPTEQEEADLEFTTAIPDANVEAQITIDRGLALVDANLELPEDALAQVVYTLTQFPTVESVEIEGKTYTRADFEDLTPAILVDSPLPFEKVSSPLRVTGTANTFEATFNYELTDTDGKIVDENFVTATSGTGTRGTFDFTTDLYTVPFDGIGSLVVFELSAKDGSRINLVEIPLRMEE